MTTLILAQKRILSLQVPLFRWSLIESFPALNKNGLFTISVLALHAIFAVTYLASLYLSFSYGFEIQKGNTSLRELEKKTLERELIVQEKIQALAGDNHPVLESMEKVSTIRYLTPENVAVSSPSLQP